MKFYAFHTSPSRVAWGIRKLKDIFGEENVKVQQTDDTDKAQPISFFYDGELLSSDTTQRYVRETFEAIINLSVQINRI